VGVFVIGYCPLSLLLPSLLLPHTVSTANDSGDVDLYVKKGSQPTTSDYDCRPYRWGNNETCSLNSGASAGTSLCSMLTVSLLVLHLPQAIKKVMPAN